MNNDELTIYIATHKPFSFTENEHYCPIQVNAKKNKHFLPVTDDMGDNISEKNNRFCELTALYWIWKNDSQSRYIGLCHYRRYFKMQQSIQNLWNSQYNQATLNENNVKITSRIKNYLDKGHIILPKALDFGELNVEKHYEKFHNQQDLEILKNVVFNLYPQYEDAWNKIFTGNKLYAFNMFVMNRHEFDKYMEWLFSILFEVEPLIPPKDDLYQNRTFGFMSERLFNVFLLHNNYSVKELPIIFLT